MNCYALQPGIRSHLIRIVDDQETMTLLFSPEPDRPYFLTRFVGEVDDRQMLEYYGEVYARQELQPIKHELADLEDADMSLVTSAGLTELARLVEDELSRHGIDSIKTAVFCPNDLPYGLARMYEAWSDSSPESVRVFRERSEAAEWLSR